MFVCLLIQIHNSEQELHAIDGLLQAYVHKKSCSVGRIGVPCCSGCRLTCYKLFVCHAEPGKFYSVLCILPKNSFGCDCDRQVLK